MASFKKLKTRAACNAGATLKVLGPDGTDTGETITVVGVDSDTFRNANRKAQRGLLQFLEDKGKDAQKTPDYQDFVAKQQVELQAALIQGWTFEEPCNDATKVELLTEAPYIAKQVDEFAGKRGNFALPVPPTSAPTPVSSST